MASRTHVLQMIVFIMPARWDGRMGRDGFKQLIGLSNIFGTFDIDHVTTMPPMSFQTFLEDLAPPTNGAPPPTEAQSLILSVA